MMQLDVAATDTQMFVGLTKPDAFRIADGCHGAAGYSVPLSSHVHQRRDGHSFLQVQESARAASRRPLQDFEVQTEISCAKQSRVAGWTSTHASLPARFVPIKTSLLLYQDHVIRDSVSQETKVLSIKKFVAVVMLMIHP